jgi:predicted nucleic-acid-binding protein
MIGLDTNVVVRYVMQDDPIQSPKANKLIESLGDGKGYITLIALVETTWVLECCYELKKHELVQALEGILKTKQFLIEKPDIAYVALKNYVEGKADFSDALIAACSKDSGCEKIMSFDKDAVSVGMERLR